MRNEQEYVVGKPDETKRSFGLSCLVGLLCLSVPHTLHPFNERIFFGVFAFSL